jgi:hypothetical protein
MIVVAISDSMMKKIQSCLKVMSNFKNAQERDHADSVVEK